MTPYVFSFVVPFLLAMALIQCLARVFWKRPEGWKPTLVLVMISALIVIIPIKGLPLGRWLISLNANFSIPFIAMLFNKVLENGFGVQLLDRKALFAMWIFAVAASITLYPMALGLGAFDPYAFGWGFSWLFVVLLIITLSLLLSKNRFGIILMGCLLCYNLRLLESQNLWDYLVDPFLVLISGGVLVRVVIKKIFGHNRGHVAGEVAGKMRRKSTLTERTQETAAPHSQNPHVVS
jgi:hypothetical protein